MGENNNTQDTQVQDDISVKSHKTTPVEVWVAVLLALLAWVSLMYVNGKLALCLGLAAIAIGIYSAVRNRSWMRRLSITAIVASAVLVSVIVAFLIVIKVGLRE